MKTYLLALPLLIAIPVNSMQSLVNFSRASATRTVAMAKNPITQQTANFSSTSKNPSASRWKKMSVVTLLTGFGLGVVARPHIDAMLNQNNDFVYNTLVNGANLVKKYQTKFTDSIKNLLNRTK